MSKKKKQEWNPCPIRGTRTRQTCRRRSRECHAYERLSSYDLVAMPGLCVDCGWSAAAMTEDDQQKLLSRCESSLISVTASPIMPTYRQLDTCATGHNSIRILLSKETTNKGFVFRKRR
jgi:hypothetical protein